jgi:formylglycine-generating enzyme required for sulfatase activity
LWRNPPETSVGARVEAGDVLGRLGDPRFSGPYRLPEFIAIPGGRFWMGSGEAEVAQLRAETGRDYFANEAPRHQVELDAFAMARYPTTNAMFACFIEAGGYADERWWPEAKGVEVWRPDGTVKDWFGGVRSQPAVWGDLRLNSPSQPVVGVTWYEATAYCRWLTATLADGFLYRLPTEAEWERAARGPGSASPSKGEGRRGSRYPWGDEWTEGWCNSSELGLERSTPAGIFPQGASAEGVLDLSGNIWEWCGDWYQEDAYRKRAGRVPHNPAGSQRGNYRVLRGGSWYNDLNLVRCASRSWGDPGGRIDHVGFRVARGSLK